MWTKVIVAVCAPNIMEKDLLCDGHSETIISQMVKIVSIHRDAKWQKTLNSLRLSARMDFYLRRSLFRQPFCSFFCICFCCETLHFTILSSSSGQKPLAIIMWTEKFNLYVNDNQIRERHKRARTNRKRFEWTQKNTPMEYLKNNFKRIVWFVFFYFLITREKN